MLPQWRHQVVGDYVISRVSLNVLVDWLSVFVFGLQMKLQPAGFEFKTKIIERLCEPQLLQ